MKVGLFLVMCHIFLISRGLQKNSLLINYLPGVFCEEKLSRVASSSKKT